MNRILLTLGSLSAVITPVISTVSCVGVMENHLVVTYEKETRMLIVSGVGIENSWSEEDHCKVGNIISSHVLENEKYGDATSIIIKGTEGKNNFFKSIVIDQIEDNGKSTNSFITLNDVIKYEYINLNCIPTNAILGYHLIEAGLSFM